MLLTHCRIGLVAFVFSAFGGSLIRADTLTLSAQLLENGVALQSSSTPPVASVTSATEATGSLASGTLGAKAGFPTPDSLPLPNMASEATWSVNAYTILNYSFAVQNVPPGFSLAGAEASFTVNVDGVASLSNTLGTGPNSLSTSLCATLTCSTYAAVDIASGETFQGAPATDTVYCAACLTGAGSQSKSVDTTVTILAPVVNGNVNFSVALTAFAECPSISEQERFAGVTCIAYADFFDPATITSAAVYNSNGNLITGATLVSQTGFSPASTPEPRTFLLLAAGGVALVMLRRSILSRH